MLKISKILFNSLSFIKPKIIRFFYRNVFLGNNVKVDWNTNIKTNKNKLIIGNNVYLRSNSNGYHAGMPFNTTILIDKENAVCYIGDNTRLNGVYLHSQKKIVIGKNTVIASGVNILDSNGHETLSYDRTVGRDTPQEIIIGDNVWIGLNSIILKGTTIGNNSIVAAGSIVKGNIPENVIVQGNPATIVRKILF